MAPPHGGEVELWRHLTVGRLLTWSEPRDTVDTETARHFSEHLFVLHIVTTRIPNKSEHGAPWSELFSKSTC